MHSVGRWAAKRPVKLFNLNCAYTKEQQAYKNGLKRVLKFQFVWKTGFEINDVHTHKEHKRFKFTQPKTKKTPGHQTVFVQIWPSSRIPICWQVHSLRQNRAWEPIRNQPTDDQGGNHRKTRVAQRNLKKKHTFGWWDLGSGRLGNTLSCTLEGDWGWEGVCQSILDD